MKAGFIGLGSMGLPMARNLLKAGHEVTVYNRTQERAENLRAEGATIAGRPGDACRSDVLITMLADDLATRAVVFGGQLIPELAAGAVHVSMSTISVALAQELTQAHTEAGSQFISAPVFGRPEAADAAKRPSSRLAQPGQFRSATRFLMPWGTAPSSWGKNRPKPTRSSWPEIPHSFRDRIPGRSIRTAPQIRRCAREVS